MRLFVAVDLDESARQSVARLQRSLDDALDGRRAIRWVQPSHLHLTLVFLGEVVPDRVPAVIAALTSDLSAPPFAMTLHGLGVFPSRGAPRVLWLGVSEGAEALVAIHRQVVVSLERLNVRVERRRFDPHLTLGRWREPRPADRRTALAADPSRPVARVDVACVTLYHSRLSPAGSTYTALAHATLT
jgi:2'-5' RNA ligase